MRIAPKDKKHEETLLVSVLTEPVLGSDRLRGVTETGGHDLSTVGLKVGEEKTQKP